MRHMRGGPAAGALLLEQSNKKEEEISRRPKKEVQKSQKTSESMWWVCLPLFSPSYQFFARFLAFFQVSRFRHFFFACALGCLLTCLLACCLFGLGVPGAGTTCLLLALLARLLSSLGIETSRGVRGSGSRCASKRHTTSARRRDQLSIISFVPQ